MTGFYVAIFVIVVGLFVMVAVWSRWRRQTGGGLGPQGFSDGHMTTTPTGYPEEMHGHGKVISPTDANSADYKNKP